MQKSEVIDTLSRFIVPVVRDGQVPPEVFVAFNGTDKDRIKRMWRNANDTYALYKELLSRGSAELIGKPSSVSIKLSSTPYFVLNFPSARIIVPFDIVDESVHDDIVSEILHVVVVRSGKSFVAKEVTPLITKAKTERGAELYEYAKSNGIPLHVIPAVAYGYVPDDRVVNLMMWRFFSLFRVGTTLHAVELTSVNSGKTTFAVRNKFTFNWEYIDEPPSPAKLIMDARDNALGVVYRSNGVFIDEIDKYAKDLEDSIPIMLSGMSHGMWTRAKGSSSTPNVIRHINVYLAGNKDVMAFQVNARQYVSDFLKAKKLNPTLVDALMDRVAVVITDNSPVNASDKVSGKVIMDSYLRGYVAYISDLANKELKDIGIAEGRRRQQANAIYALCKVATDIEDCETIAQQVVTGVTV